MRFKPAHRGHFWCDALCRQSHFKADTGQDLGGGFGSLSDPKMVRAFDNKWITAAGRRTRPTKKKAPS
ncbi:hypothetical protein HOU03_gp321 [Caulobacter phage CcrSC]|uniref:Uncharacterized protein n=1 Tax=Caulobacter phage CcrSC TaxID=2283272 RepID=A0A385EGC2_9CAUD|nr:hypothetical protein HOU03_gp321 [Caulobacter phage CcrSC]AXQ69947.1 hypothetical protein CcrSC_gp365 [Caulobacter phage CcrSC]